MAPEQAEGKTLDARSDIFSFGAVLYEMLSGERAFRGNSTFHAIAAVLRDEPVRLPVSAELWQILCKCLAKRPADRFASASELRRALTEVTAPSDGFLKLSTRTRQRAFGWRWLLSSAPAPARHCPV